MYTQARVYIDYTYIYIFTYLFQEDMLRKLASLWDTKPTLMSELYDLELLMHDCVYVQIRVEIS